MYLLYRALVPVRNLSRYLSDLAGKAHSYLTRAISNGSIKVVEKIEDRFTRKVEATEKLVEIAENALNSAHDFAADAIFDAKIKSRKDTIKVLNKLG